MLAFLLQGLTFICVQAIISTEDTALVSSQDKRPSGNFLQRLSIHRSTTSQASGDEHEHSRRHARRHARQSMKAHVNAPLPQLHVLLYSQAPSYYSEEVFEIHTLLVVWSP